ncbi:MAG: hypothetical protein WD009_00205 [Phycisphaeraceae bacterium]
MTPTPATPRRSVFESVSRRGYWLGIASIMAALILLFWLLDWYQPPEPPEDAPGRSIRRDPTGADWLYSPLGVFIIILLLQFCLANALFWPAVWLRSKIARPRPATRSDEKTR